MADENIFVFVKLGDSGDSVYDVNSYDIFGRLAKFKVKEIIRIGENRGLFDPFRCLSLKGINLEGSAKRQEKIALFPRVDF